MDAQTLLAWFGQSRDDFWPWGWEVPPMAPWLPAVYPHLAEQLRPKPPPPPDRTADARALLETYGVCEDAFWPQPWPFPPMAPWLPGVDPALAERLRPPPPPETWCWPTAFGALELTARWPPRVPVLARPPEDCTREPPARPRRLRTSRDVPVVTLDWLDHQNQQVQHTATPVEGLERLLGNGLTSWLPQQALDDLRGQLQPIAQRWTQGTPQRCEQPPSCPTDRAPHLGPSGQVVLGGEPCCRWPVEHIQETYYVSKAHGNALVDGSDPSAPTTLGTLRFQLQLERTAHNGGSFPKGVRILFLEGDDPWEEGDRVVVNGVKAFLHLFAEGSEKYPIHIGSYVEETLSTKTPKRNRPLFIGDGDIHPNGNLGVPTHNVTPATGFGFYLEGARWVQLEGLSITNCQTGIGVRSFLNGGAPSNTPGEEVRGIRDINLLDLKVYENWEDGIGINVALSSLLTGLGKRIDSLYVVGPGTLDFIATTGALIPIPVHEDGWWPERVCIEDCEIYANGEGSLSSGVNLGLSNQSSLCVIRRNRIYGAEHSKGWHNQCGRYAARQESRPPDVTLKEPWRPAAGTLVNVPDPQWTRWGNDGLTMTNGGGGNIVENNYIARHAVQQSAGASAPPDCQRDDGNGLDLKSTGNRTYYSHIGGQTRLCDLPNVIRNNLITENQGPAIVIHFGCRNLHIYNNELSYNLGNDAAGISITSQFLNNGLWRDEYTAAEGVTYDADTAGPALTQDIFIYRNMIFKNGYYPYPGDPARDKLAPQGVGANAITIRSTAGEYSGSFDKIWIINNTFAFNNSYALSIRFDLQPDALDYNDYFFNNLKIINNIFALNTGNITPTNKVTAIDGVQVKFRDEVSSLDGQRGFLCEMESHNNCFYNPLDLPFPEIVEFTYGDNNIPNFINAVPFTLTDMQLLSIPIPLSSGGICLAGKYELHSIDENPSFVQVSQNNFHIAPNTSPCEGSGVVGLGHRSGHSVHYDACRRVVL